MTRARHEARLATVVFLRRGSDVLLLRHPRDKDRFAGCWDGIGGHVEPGEDLHEAARRELQEEAGIEVRRLQLRGLIHESGMVGHHYVLFLFTGEAPAGEVESPEGLELDWHPAANVAALPLVEDLRHWLPALLAAREPLFITERYDGGDGLLEVLIDSKQVYCAPTELPA